VAGCSGSTPPRSGFVGSGCVAAELREATEPVHCLGVARLGDDEESLGHGVRFTSSLVPGGEKDLEGFDDESVVVELGKA
jgi:hypothetical protein